MIDKTGLQRFAPAKRGLPTIWTYRTSERLKDVDVRHRRFGKNLPRVGDMFYVMANVERRPQFAVYFVNHTTKHFFDFCSIKAPRRRRDRR